METIGRYQIITELGRGGMAVVYRALDPNIGREVALKLMSREFLADPEFHQRFIREARAIGALESTAIVPLHDFGEDKGQPYLVMRLMTGGSLVERLRQGPLSLAEATEMLSRLAEALDEAHAKGIIHRDLKPGNILLDHKGAPYLADFGIVKLLESSSMTSRGAIGTPAYMSPEHFEGEVSAQSDIYALGVILFQMLTGKLPFQARTPSEWLKAHLMDAPLPLRHLNSALPVALEAVIQRALAKKPEQRYRSAGELVADLRQVTTAAPPPQPDPSPAYLVSSTQQSYPLKKGSLTLGRSSTCDIAVDDTLASRRHAVLEFDGQQCMVYDENSANGTFINEQRVGTAGLPFKLGDTLRIGQITLTLSVTASNPSWSDGPTVPKVNTQAETVGGRAADGVNLADKATVVEVSEPISPLKPVLPKVELPKPVTPANNWKMPPIGKKKVVKPKGSSSYVWLRIVMITTTPILIAVLIWGIITIQNQNVIAETEARIKTRAMADAQLFKDEHGIPMIKIPAGPFQMGNDKGNDDEKPAHTVTLAEFYMDKYEITNAQYTVCVNTGKCTPPHDTTSATRQDYYSNAAYQDYPVIRVDWSQAKAYCAWRGGRLPTEAEWEKAARGTDGWTYPWGNEEPNDTLLNYNSKVGDTIAIGSYLKGASPYGVMDMAGNVWEWTSSDYKPYPYKADDGREYLLSNNSKVLRGGGWTEYGSGARMTYRSTTNWNYDVGSRCVR